METVLVKAIHGIHIILQSVFLQRKEKSLSGVVVTVISA